MTRTITIYGMTSWRGLSIPYKSSGQSDGWVSKGIKKGDVMKKLQVIIKSMNINRDKMYIGDGNFRFVYNHIDVECILIFEDETMIETTYKGIREHLDDMSKTREYIAGLHNCELSA
jgi:hypothetical protein